MGSVLVTVFKAVQKTVGSQSECFLLQSQLGMSNSGLYCSPNVPKPGVECDLYNVSGSLMDGTVFQGGPGWTGMGVRPATK